MSDFDGLQFEKGGGLVPAIVQHADTGVVLMLGYMNREAVKESLKRQRVVFFSRSKGRLWEKGETSGHTLHLKAIQPDCDGDSLLVLAHPQGPTCHRGTSSCFGDDLIQQREPLSILTDVERVIGRRKFQRSERSYTTSLFESGIRRIAQKVGEESLEVALAAVGGPESEVIRECADLLYHLLVLLAARDLSLDNVLSELRERHRVLETSDPERHAI